MARAILMAILVTIWTPRPSVPEIRTVDSAPGYVFETRTGTMPMAVWALAQTRDPAEVAPSLPTNLASAGVFGERVGMLAETWEAYVRDWDIEVDMGVFLDPIVDRFCVGSAISLMAQPLDADRCTLEASVYHSELAAIDEYSTEVEFDRSIPLSNSPRLWRNLRIVNRRGRSAGLGSRHRAFLEKQGHAVSPRKYSRSVGS